MDIKAYLSDSQISYRDKGKNVSRGWIEIRCPYDDCDDRSFHMGINLKSNKYNCWICGRKGYFIDLIKIIEKCNYLEAKRIEQKYDDGSFIEEVEIKSADKLWLPPGIQIRWSDSYLDYLQDRRFDPDFIIKKYRLMPMGNVGIYRFRILVPIFLNDKMVSWQAMDTIRNKTRIPYLACPPEKSILSLNHCLYNIDSVKDKVIVVEGITDVWRIGDGCVATFTKNFTREQMLLLKKMKIKIAFILYDSDAEVKNRELANQLSCMVNHVEYISLGKGDPADMSDKEVKELTDEIFR